MSDLFEKIVHTGVGLAFATKEKLEEIGEELVKVGKLTEKEARQLIDDVMKKSESAKSEIKSQIEKAVETAMTKMNLATRDEVEKLQAEITKLRQELKKKAKD
ncbi:phasin family protein [candidate division KSB1 bacterium]|nr:phasin family protein [candidate division KSB1 bacterium]